MHHDLIIMNAFNFDLNDKNPRKNFQAMLRWIKYEELINQEVNWWLN